jgi:hypothetical protein
MKTPVNRVGPKVRVRVEYECNGCEYHRIDEDTNEGAGVKYHACHHPAVLQEYRCPQWSTGGREDLTIHHTAATPKHLCPYLADRT